MGWTIIFEKYSSNWIMSISRGTYLLLTHEKKSGGCTQLRLVYPAIYQEFKHTLQQLAIQSHLLTKKLHTLMTPKNQHGNLIQGSSFRLHVRLPGSISWNLKSPHFWTFEKTFCSPKMFTDKKKLPPSFFLEKKNPPLFQLPNVIPVFLSIKCH